MMDAVKQRMLWKKTKTNKQRESKCCETIKMIRIINASQVSYTFSFILVIFLSASKTTTEGKKEHPL